ncbi:MAG: multicopper oxidase family protein [Acidimicrobiales bacterium]
MVAAPGWTRRRFLTVGSLTAAGVWLGGCTSDSGRSEPSARGLMLPSDPSIAARETQRRSVDAGLTTVDLTAGPVTVDLGGVVVDTTGYGDTVPGPLIRVRAGDELAVTFRNQLADPTVIHWHGLAIRNDMDGVPGLTQEPVPSGGEFTYRFVVPDPGTYWFHPHMGLDLDRGMYAPIIVDDPDEPGDYDTEDILIFDDWIDGIDGASPDTVLADLLAAGGMGHGEMMGSGGGGMMGMSSFGDVDYPLHLINGRAPSDPITVTGPPGGRVRLRMINAGSDTVYRVAIGGHAMTVTHLDGFPIEPVEVDTVLLSMGERVDVTVTVGDGMFPIVASAEGKTLSGVAWLRSAGSAATTPEPRPLLPEHDGRLLDVAAATATESVAYPTGTPDRAVDVRLGQDMGSYRWTINGATHGNHEPLRIESGERVRLRFGNDTMMVHPMHLHGHTFALATSGAARKDTLLVPVMGSSAVDVIADNPGQWMLHCHNTYHLEAGMATTLAYLA